MVSASQFVPDRILAIEDDARRKRAIVTYLSEMHGQKRNNKRLLLIVADEEDLDIDGNDVRAVTDRAPVETSS